MSTVLSSPAERRWEDPREAPGDDCVRLRSVRIVDEDLRTIESIDVRRPFGIETVFDVAQQKYPFVPAVYIKNEQDVAAFLALDTDTAWREPPRAGRYVSIAWVPANLLNEGRMFVTVLLATLISGGKSIKRAVAFDVVGFQVIDFGEGGTARGDFVGVWTEPVRPLLSWTTRVSEMTPDLEATTAASVANVV